MARRTAFYTVSVLSFIILLWPNLMQTGSLKTITFSHIYILRLTILVWFAAEWGKCFCPENTMPFVNIPTRDTHFPEKLSFVCRQEF